MRRLRPIALTLILAAAVGSVGAVSPPLADDQIRSHPPLRKAPPPLKRPAPTGPVYYVDAQKGDDAQGGTKAKPWKTIGHALRQLKAGDTLYLRGGTYYENVRVSLVGTRETPLTIASYPGEQAILDGGIRDFFEAPGDAWQPSASAQGEYRSKRPYPNLRNVVGAFGDSMIGLQTYYHAEDFRASDETVAPNAQGTDVRPLYCGPGVWYDRATGYLYARLQHTHVEGFDNYRGQTDPRKLPLVIAPFRSVPLHLDQAEHVRFQDLVVRGGGYDTVVLTQASDIELDNVTVWCGTYGLRATGTRRLNFYRSALYGGIAPWTTRFESGFNTYPGRTTRNITRLNTHALLVTDAGREFSVYHYPFNDDWEIAYSEFTDASDGLYLGGVSMRFHHNLVHNTHDDGIYLSPMYERHKIFGGGATLHISQNYLGRCLTVLAFGGTEDNHDTVYFYRNVVDLRAPIQTGRPGPKNPRPAYYSGKVTGDHGSPPWSSLVAYHNTLVVRSRAEAPDMWMARGSAEGRPRKVFNNVFVHLDQLGGPSLPDAPHLQIDGNLYWQPGLDAKRAATFFAAYRSSPLFAKSKQAYPPGFDSHSLVADPQFSAVQSDPLAPNDYRLQKGSPAIDAGIDLPTDWPDPLRKQDPGKPDIGALPLGAEPLRVGRAAAPQ